MTATTTVDLYVIARIEQDRAVADLYSCEVFYDADDGAEAGRTVQGWWESVQAESDSATTTIDLDGALTTNGYRRTTGWRKRVTASGAVRYFADAVASFEDL
ncbi:hypothetical protein ACWIGW_45405 [Nocardia brasiliensis]|uniref:hypothetical protein n=1 Tax=Streptomyces sp. NPDC056056 TaxID=3345698 RepID=UPI0035D56554